MLQTLHAWSIIKVLLLQSLTLVAHLYEPGFCLFKQHYK